MSMRDALVLVDAPSLPEALRRPIEGVSFASYLFVEASRLDGLPLPAVLEWLGVREATFARVEEQWSERVAEALASDTSHLFDEAYEELLTRALSVWSRSIDPLDRNVEAWMAFQRHALAAADSGELARRAALTAGDEMRLARLWRERLADPEIAARAADAWSGPLGPLPKLSVAPFIFPPAVVELEVSR